MASRGFGVLTQRGPDLTTFSNPVGQSNLKTTRPISNPTGGSYPAGPYPNPFQTKNKKKRYYMQKNKKGGGGITAPRAKRWIAQKKLVVF